MKCLEIVCRRPTLCYVKIIQCVQTKRNFAASNNTAYAGDPRLVYVWKLYSAFKWKGSLLLVIMRQWFTARLWRKQPTGFPCLHWGLPYWLPQKGDTNMHDAGSAMYAGKTIRPFRSQSESKLQPPHWSRHVSVSVYQLSGIAIISCSTVQRVNTLPL
jgi:hypothetical protein